LLFAQATTAPAEPPKNIVEALPEQAPAWPAGYQLRYTLRVVGDIAQSPSKTIVARLPTGSWLRPDGSDVAVQAADGTLLPVAVRSHAATGETLIQFPRHANDVWYWAVAMNPAAPAAAAQPILEGIVLEVRDWAAGDLSSWNAVRAGLTKSDPVIANAFVAEIMQNCNPGRPASPRNYAVAYHGYLNIKQDGVYRFFVNSEDASFLFIDGLKVCDRPGANPRVVGNVPTRSIGSDLDLKAGVHPIEVYQVLAESPTTYGGCMLLWVPPGAKVWAVVPRDAFAQPDFAHVAAVEAAGPATAAVFDYGIEDCLVTAGGATLHLVRFEAQGDLPEEDARIVWDFGDGTIGTGRSARHVYFAPGDYKVGVSCFGPLPPYQRRVHVWAAPGAISPFSVGIILQSLAVGWRTLPVERQDQVLDFLLTCDHPDRWPFIAELAQERLKAQGLDPQFRARLYRSWIEALGHTGRPNDLTPVIDRALKEFAKLPTLQVGIELAEALAYQRQFKDADEAARRYQVLLEKHRRLEHPDVRLAAIRWGDVSAEAGDARRAAELYKIAATLGGESFLTSASSDAVTRGALLRVAEQKLRKGDILETRQLLDKIELNYPEQKLEGLYRFLRAESDRYAGRYEDSLRNYEVLLHLKQWAGFRDRALHGIADCYARMDDLPQALRWLAQLEKAFPGYYEKQKLSDLQKLLVARQGRIAAQPSPEGQAARPPRFQDFRTGFEPQEPEWFGKPDNFKIVRGLGIAGPHVGLLETYPVYRGYLTYNRPLANLTPGGHYWVECWYREDFFDMLPGFNPHVYLYVYGEGTQIDPTRGQGTYFLERSPGAWRKAGFVLDAPPANDGRVALGLLAVGAIQLDALSVQAVTDRQLDALSNFIERTATGGSP
jgi:tetratricopeptide (TPR) repeat protein